MNLLEYLLDAASWVRPSGGIALRIVQHLVLTLIAVGIAAVVAVSLGVLIGHVRRGRVAVRGVSQIARSVPTLGLLVLTVLLIGAGNVGVGLPLVILALPPILAATVTGMHSADHDAVHTARALGLSPVQVAVRIELPLAAPQVVAGLRSATVQVVAVTTVAAYTGAGGLGRLIVDGQRVGPGGYPQMFAGAVLVAVLGIVLDVLLAAIGRLVGGRTGSRRAADDLALAPIL